MYYQLQPSAPRTEDTGYSSWATPSAADSVGSHGEGQGRSLRTDISNWKKGLWPTPTASETTARENIELTESGRRACSNGSSHSLDLATVVKIWPTPQARDYKGSSGRSIKGHELDLPTAIKNWPTPAAQDAKNSTLPPSQIDRDTVPGAVMREGHEGQLNPDWVESLMGFPIGWTDLGVDEPDDHFIDNPRWPAAMGQEQYDWEPPRVAVGVKNRVERLKACGNAVNPAQVYPILEAIKKVHEARFLYG
ncbi:hypothetical protein [Brevibacillus laterosporus]|uniref:hypothetical protein n=1 Tax=Brevibacillus laterosporus TaxID=1465 RepID=UPI0013CEE389